MTFFTDTHPIARKQHRCQTCRRAIRPGEKYRRGVCLDGQAWTWKECPHCEVLARWVVHLYDLEEYDWCSIADWDCETVGQLRIKAWWRKQWQHADGSLHPVPTLTVGPGKYPVSQTFTGIVTPSQVAE